ncbi:hypothetical protein QYE76_003912 [Lolium multiflorum]|uniref:Integrase catalytic domain-containing protein n=1 Tax=Lolium multiflorum TaxID=4521 RepID=A0AAD8VZP7_LOLMU|nr:hypothetical protein QYE76_003912 [Lolium multiflorum]
MAIKHFQARVEVETGRKLRTLRTDRGGEFTSTEFSEYCDNRGVQRHLTAPYSPQQNGVVERRNQTVVHMARSGVPMVFIGYEDGGKSYRVYDPVGNRVHVTRDVVFEESARWNWSKDADETVVDCGESFTVEYVTYKVPCGPHAAPAVEDECTAELRPTRSAEHA